MKKCFNNVQMFKSSENCDKYSKSVSYETLVGGTATTGRDNRQIRRLFKGSVDKPLTAVGTLTSLLCNSVKVVEKMLQTSHVLRLVKVLDLVTVLSFRTISESSAESWNCGPKINDEYSDSVICTYDEKSKTLIIEGEGNMGNYALTPSGSKTTPWTGKEIVHAVIKGNVTSIGDRVFKSVTSLQDISGTENITSIGVASFADAKKLTTADFPNVTYIGQMSFYGAKNLEYANFAQGAIFEEEYPTLPTFGLTKIPECRTTGKCCNGYIKRGVGCVKDCGENFRPNDGECDRLRYTPAEAAEVLKNDNTNEVTITFKK